LALTGGRRLRVDRARREQVVLVSGRQGGVKFGRGDGAGESGGERGRREVRASAPARPRRVRRGMRVSPRVMGRELAHVCQQPQHRCKIYCVVLIILILIKVLKYTNTIICARFIFSKLYHIIIIIPTVYYYITRAY